MKQWAEPSKTAFLILLIFISFYLTSMLWNDRPQFQPIEPAQYVKSKPVQVKQLKELVTPESVLFHYGDDTHTKAYSNFGQYRFINTEMSKWYFNDFVYYPMSDERWDKLTSKSEGLEIEFRSSIPISVLSQFLNFQDEGFHQIKQIDRIWLVYVQEEGTVYALFIDSDEGTVLRSRTSVTAKDLRESYLRFGKQLPEQIRKLVKVNKDHASLNEEPSWYVYYLPKEPLKMQQFLYNYLPITESEMIEAYFLDRTLVRQIVERDRNVIFTDGNRSIQLRPDQQVITFTDPAFQQGKPNVTKEDKVQGAISFINSHLGWTDDYHFEKIKENDNQEDIITFRQYLGAYPVVSMADDHLDSIAIVSESGQVVSMKRSLIDLDKFIDHKEWNVMSGPELFQYLRQQKKIDTRQIKNAYLAYEAKVHQGYVELLPTWIVEKMDGTTEHVNARSVNGGGRSSGLE